MYTQTPWIVKINCNVYSRNFVCFLSSHGEAVSTLSRYWDGNRQKKELYDEEDVWILNCPEIQVYFCHCRMLFNRSIIFSSLLLSSDFWRRKHSNRTWVWRQRQRPDAMASTLFVCVCVCDWDTRNATSLLVRNCRDVTFPIVLDRQFLWNCAHPWKKVISCGECGIFSCCAGPA